MSVHTSDPTIGRLIDGRYQVRSRIARGGMATVYLATDLRLERRVAIKIMHHHLADDEQFKQRFIQEARSAARLAHPNVVNVFDQGQDAESAYLVMEYLPGITLRELLHDYGALTAEQTIDITEAVLSGLAAAHKAGIVHRDLKPENVLLADDGRIKIGDFGLARAASANTATGAALLGTIAYLSPELVTRGVADTRSDIYAVGIMMYEMLTGEQPFKGEQPMQIAYQHANDSVPTPSTKNPKVPAELDELVLWATARDPEERPADARAMLEQLHDTESLLQTALPPTATSAQRTMVLPSAPMMPAPSNSETQVLGGTPAVQTTGEVSENTAALGAAAGRRRRRGVVALLLVLLLAAGALGAGWWFGAGPGAAVTIPDEIRSMPFDEAAALLEERGLQVSPEPGEAVYDIEVEEGLVAASTPAIGAPASKDRPVVLQLSAGPRPIPMTIERNMPRADAEAIVAESNWQLLEAQERFDPEIEAGRVVDALNPDGKSVIDNRRYGEGRGIQLVLSLGAVPDVRGLTIDAAREKLEAVGLKGSEPELRYSDEYPADQVMAMVLERDGQPIVFRKGDTVSLVVSRGPEPVSVPAVRGLVWTEAEALLKEAGFEIAFSNDSSQALAFALPGFAYVTELDPGEGETAPKGSTVTITLQAGGG